MSASLSVIMWMVFITLFCIVNVTCKDGEHSEEEAVIAELNSNFADSLKTAPFKLDAESQRTLEELDVDVDDYTVHQSNNGEEEATQADQCETLDSNTRPVKFINKWVLKRQVVILSGLLQDSPAILSWDRNYLSNAPPSALTKISAFTASNNTAQLSNSTAQRNSQQYFTSLRNFIRHDEDNGDYLEDEVPSYLQKDIAFPRCLKCDDVLNSLASHSVTYQKPGSVTLTSISELDRLICTIRGKHTHKLYTYSRSCQTLSPGDCIYIPANTSDHIQHDENTDSIAVTFHWSQLTYKASRSSCGQQLLDKAESMSAYKFTRASEQRDMLKDALIHYFLFYLGDSLTGSFTQKQFLRKIRRDKQLFSKTIEWTGELEEISTEVFESLDVNKDKTFNLRDTEDLVDKKREELISDLSERLQDIGYIIEKQKFLADKNQKSASKASSVGANEFGQDLQQEIDKMLAELESNIDKSKISSSDKSPDDVKQKRSKSKSKKEKSGKKSAKQKTQSKPVDDQPLNEQEVYEIVEESEEEILAEEPEEYSDSQTTAQRMNKSSKKTKDEFDVSDSKTTAQQVNKSSKKRKDEL